MKDTIGIAWGEASTWRGIFLLLTLIGVKLDPSQTEAIMGAGLTLYSLIAIFWRRAPSGDKD